MRSLRRVLARVTCALAVVLVSGSAWSGRAQTLRMDSTSYPTMGNPNSALATLNQQYVLVTVNNVGGAFPGSGGGSGQRRNAVCGIQVFRVEAAKLKPFRFVRIGETGANGLALLPGGKTLAVGVGNAGVAFVEVEDVVHGKPELRFVDQGEDAGTTDVVATPDGKYVFAANEYGLADKQHGNVGIIAVQGDEQGRVTHPQSMGHIPAGNTVPSLSLSRDGSRLYVASEVAARNNPATIAGATNTILTKNDCVQRPDTPPHPNGLITVIDVQRIAVSAEGDSPVRSRVAAGCSPVRIAESADESTLFVSARGDNRILTFSTHLLESDPEHAFERALPSGGEAPVGMHLFASDRMLLVANSNRFGDGNGNAAVLDISEPARSAVVSTVRTGRFPRNISLAPDGHSLYLTNYMSRTLQVLVPSIP